MLKGITIVDRKPLFSLYSSEEKASKWVALGQSFSGYQLSEYDPETEILTLLKDTTRENIRMQNSGIKDSRRSDALARISGLKGLDLAYELARQADQWTGKNPRLDTAFKRLNEALQEFQASSRRVQEAGNSVKDVNDPKTRAALEALDDAQAICYAHAAISAQQVAAEISQVRDLR